MLSLQLFFLISICFLLPLWFFQVILVAPIIDFSLVQASGRKYPESMSGSWLLLLEFIRFAPVWPCLHFSSDKRDPVFSQARIDLHLEKTCLILSLPQKAHNFSKTYPWRKTPEQWKLPLSRSWLIQSFSDPWLPARNFVIFWGQTLRLWSSHHERSIGDNPTLSWSFKRMSLFVLVSLPCLFLNFTKASQMLPLRRKTYVSSLILFGPLLTVLKSVLESAHHSSIFQSVPNCVFVPNPQKKNNKNTVVSASFRPFTCFLEAFEDTNSWSTEGVALATSSQVAALSGVCGDPGIAFFLFASRTRDERLEKHWKKKTSDSQKLRWLDGFF